MSGDLQSFRVEHVVESFPPFDGTKATMKNLIAHEKNEWICEAQGCEMRYDDFSSLSTWNKHVKDHLLTVHEVTYDQRYVRIDVLSPFGTIRVDSAIMDRWFESGKRRPLWDFASLFVRNDSQIASERSLELEDLKHERTSIKGPRKRSVSTSTASNRKKELLRMKRNMRSIIEYYLSMDGLNFQYCRSYMRQLENVTSSFSNVSSTGVEGAKVMDFVTSCLPAFVLNGCQTNENHEKVLEFVEKVAQLDKPFIRKTLLRILPEMVHCGFRNRVKANDILMKIKMDRGDSERVRRSEMREDLDQYRPSGYVVPPPAREQGRNARKMFKVSIEGNRVHCESGCGGDLEWEKMTSKTSWMNLAIAHLKKHHNNRKYSKKSLRIDLKSGTKHLEIDAVVLEAWLDSNRELELFDFAYFMIVKKVGADQKSKEVDDLEMISNPKTRQRSYSEGSRRTMSHATDNQ